MPVLINKETGLAEDLPDNQIESALYAKTHEIPLVDQNGNLGSSPIEDARNLVMAGTHQQPSAGQLQGLLNKARYSTPAEMAKTFAEGAAEATTFGLSTPLEIAMGAKPEDIKGRRDENPKTHMLGQMSGLLAGAALPGGAEAGALKALGEGAETAAFGTQGAGELSLVARAARAGTRLAAEGAAFQAGDELSQHFSDPERSAGMAAANIGMAALTTPLIGGVLGGAAELFKATKAQEIQSILEAGKDYIDAGEAGETMMPNVVESLQKYPELQGALSNNTAVQRSYQDLLNSSSHFGTEFGSKVSDFKDAIEEGALNRMGMTADEIEGPVTTSDNQVGKKAIQSITDAFKERHAPIKAMYDDVAEKYGDASIYPAHRKTIAQELADFAEKENFAKDPSGLGYKMMEQIDKDLPLQKTADDLRTYSQKFWEKLPNYEQSYLRRNLQNIFEGAADDVVKTRVGEELGEEASNAFQEAKAHYAGIKNDLGEIAARLRFGKYKGVGGALSKLNDMIPEEAIKRLSRTNDADFTSFLQEKLPDVYDMVKKKQLEDIARDSVLKSGFNLNRFVSKIDELPPEARQSILDPDLYNQIKSDNNLLSRIQSTINPSGTAKAASGMMRKTVGGLGGYALGATIGPKAAFLMSTLGKYFGDVPDAIRLAFLRSVGQGKTPDAMAFSALVDAAGNVSKSMNKINSAVRSVISGSGSFAVDAISDRKVKQLEQAAETFQNNPDKFIENENNLATYEPDHAAARSSMISTAMQVINNAKPKFGGMNMLDAQKKPSKVENAQYMKTLQMIENPMTVLHEVKRGTLTPQALNTFTSVYPGLHKMMIQKITDNLIDMKSKGKNIPYKQRLSLSMFMGMPLDSTMMPSSISSNQPQPLTQQTAQQPSGPRHGSLKELTKLPNLAETSSQSREMKRAMR